jgi:hypothetical protein
VTLWSPGLVVKLGLDFHGGVDRGRRLREVRAGFRIDERHAQPLQRVM